MNKIFKVGKTLVIKYRKQNSKDVLDSVGVIYKISPSEITLVHNFSKSFPIDKTTIKLNNIINSEEIEPKEINSIYD